jgi:hypothetical protein
MRLRGRFSLLKIEDWVIDPDLLSIGNKAQEILPTTTPE